METPVLIIVFNRPEPTKKVLAQLAKVKPKHVFIAADGHRPNVPGEQEICEQTRALKSIIDWDCHVSTLYRDDNLGCKKAVSGAIDWFFENVDAGIILEDDCVPSESFFKYCAEMLEMYKNDDRIMHVAGTNLHLGKQFTPNSYFFSQLTPVWGWATWKRAWKKYDRNLDSFPEALKNKDIFNLYNNNDAQVHLFNNLEKVYRNEIDTWDYQWEYTVRINNGLSVYPENNLIENIGFGIDAGVHTNYVDYRISQNKANEIKFPLSHPTLVVANAKADKEFFNEFNSNSTMVRIKRKIKKVLKAL